MSYDSKWALEASIYSLLGIGAFLIASQVHAQTAAEAASIARLEQATHEVLDAQITFSGEVVDDSGQPLQGVDARVEIVRFDETSPTLTRSESQEAIVDGFFRFSCNACVEIRVGFSRQGYHQRTVFADYSEAKLKNAVVEKVWQKVLLHRVGAPQRLARFEGRLVVEEGGSEQVLPVGEKASGRPAFLSVLPKDSRSGSPLPFVRLEVGQEGAAIATKSLPGKAAVQAALSPRVDFGPGGAVQAYQPRARNIKEIRYEMREAPEAGYQDKLELDPESSQVVYFYCKIGELYGRGSATPAMVEQTNEGKRVVAHIEIELNPDGSRNLETLE